MIRYKEAMMLADQWKGGANIARKLDRAEQTGRVNVYEYDEDGKIMMMPVSKASGVLATLRIAKKKPEDVIVHAKELLDVALTQLRYLDVEFGKIKKAYANRNFIVVLFGANERKMQRYVNYHRPQLKGQVTKLEEARHEVHIMKAMYGVDDRDDLVNQLTVAIVGTKSLHDVFDDEWWRASNMRYDAVSTGFFYLIVFLSALIVVKILFS